jgi:hypothetical protein
LFPPITLSVELGPEFVVIDLHKHMACTWPF